MKVVVVIDFLKGSFFFLEVGNVIKELINEVILGVDVEVYLLVDGGEGIVEVLMLGMGGMIEIIFVKGFFGEKVYVSYGIIL